jgi:hypothetical protein
MPAVMTLFVAQLLLVACHDDPAGIANPECALGTPVRNALEIVVRDCPAQPDPDACARKLMADAGMPNRGTSRGRGRRPSERENSGQPLCNSPFHVSEKDGCQP